MNLFPKMILVALASQCGAAMAQDVLIRGARVHTATEEGTRESTDVLVRGGKIVAVGSGLAVGDGAQVVDARGRALTPGLFGGLSTLGVVEIPAESTTSDSQLDLKTSAWEQWRPEFEVALAYNPRSTLVPVARVEGITWVVLTPGNADSILSGQGAAVTLDGRYDAVLKGTQSLFITLGGAAHPQSGGSRAGQYMLLDQAFREVRTTGPMQVGALLHPAGREALARYLPGGRVVIEVDRAADIRAAIRFAQRYGLKPIIASGNEAWLVADEIAAAGVPVILDPLQNLPDDFDSLGSRLDNAALLQKAGVRIAFTSTDGHNARKIRQQAGNAVTHGLGWDAALAAITANPAEIFGLGASRGRIAPGQSADLVLWSGDPLEVTTTAEQVWIAGAPVAMRSRQTELRDRYVERAKAADAR